MCRSAAAAFSRRSWPDRVDFGFSPIATSLPNIKEGRLQALAVSSPKRATALPDLPTTLEAGYADSDYVIWFGIFLPAKTPRAIVDKLAAATRKTLETAGAARTFRRPRRHADADDATGVRRFRPPGHRRQRRRSPRPRA